jgi:1-acyl-sn-glycerol-3-phosphate acyltransferase
MTNIDPDNNLPDNKLSDNAADHAAPAVNFLPTLTPLQTLWYGLRAAVFYVGYGLLTAWFGITAGIFVRWLGYKACVVYIRWWNVLVVRWLRLICGVRFRVEGADNIPARPYVIVAKHQSQWETFYLQTLFSPNCTILKKELLELPVFGWGLATVKPIGIDRSQPRESLKKIVDDGCDRLQDGICVLIFPEGTRIDPGQRGRYARGGADLARKAGVPMLPIAHNAGEHWPSKRFLKYPGEITVVIGSPIASTTPESRSLMNQAEAWIEAEVERVSRYPKSGCQLSQE